MEFGPAVWIGFNLFVLAMLALDLGVFHRKAHAVGVREALTWTVVWIALSLIFCGVVYFWRGPELAMEFLAGYLIEKSLSVDNIFVFLLIFSYFQVPSACQHRVLFWGILSALVLRGLMIGLGVLLIERFHWVIYLFGAFLIYTAFRIAFQKETDLEPGRNPIVRLLRRVMPVTDRYHGGHFFARENGRLYVTPLLLALAMVEFTDVVFALDSIPAIFAVSQEPFIVYTSNVFAILGLRSLYFALSGVIGRFYYLKPGLAAVLGFVGVKMLITDFFKIPIGISLAVIAGILGIAIAASILRPPAPVPKRILRVLRRQGEEQPRPRAGLRRRVLP